MFQSSPSCIEANGANDPANNIVTIIGPDLLSGAYQGATKFITDLQSGFSQNRNPQTNPNAYRNPEQAVKAMKGFLNVVNQAIGDVNQVIADEAMLVDQTPDQALRGLRVQPRSGLPAASLTITACSWCRYVFSAKWLHRVYRHPVPIIVIV